MDPIVSWTNSIFGSLSLIFQVASLGLIIFLVSKGKLLRPYGKTIQKHVLWIGLFISFGGVAGSLWYSEFIGFAPCELCWYQRIFLYPQPLLFLIAIVRRERMIIPYALVLSIGGGLIALLQYYGQMTHSTFLSCSTGGGTSCTERYALEFGYITIPFMAFAAFLFIALALVAGRKLSTD